MLRIRKKRKRVSFTALNGIPGWRSSKSEVPLGKTSGLCKLYSSSIRRLHHWLKILSGTTVTVVSILRHGLEKGVSVSGVSPIRITRLKGTAEGKCYRSKRHVINGWSLWRHIIPIALHTREELYQWSSKTHWNFSIAHEFILCPLVRCSMED